MEILKDYVCTAPFDSLEVHDNVYFLCCPSWLKKKIHHEEYPIDNVWNSNPVLEIRESILDGSYKFCDRDMCPHLSKLLKFGVESGPIKRKDKMNESLIFQKSGPENIIMNFDRSCNYKCPSCRNDLIIENLKGIKKIENIIDEIDIHFSKTLKTIYITGTGDPFVSVGFRKYLRNFDPSKYNILQRIHLHTNASMWNKEMWDSMPNVHKYVRSCEISIDAGTKETYETKTRIGGNWDNLLSNLRFISTLPNLNKIKTSFVVQDSNFKEMKLFHNIMYEIFGKRVSVFFGKITNWGTYSEEAFSQKKIWDINHPLHDEFLEEFQSVWKLPNVYHNLYEFIKNDRNKKSLI